MKSPLLRLLCPEEEEDQMGDDTREEKEGKRRLFGTCFSRGQVWCVCVQHVLKTARLTCLRMRERREQSTFALLLHSSLNLTWFEDSRLLPQDHHRLTDIHARLQRGHWLGQNVRLHRGHRLLWCPSFLGCNCSLSRGSILTTCSLVDALGSECVQDVIVHT